MTEAGEISAELYDKVLETDLANIIRKATAGQPLTKREREMIEAEKARLKKSREPDFKLEGAGARSPLERLTQEQLASRWGYSLRQIKNWIHDGREVSDPCPLTRPAEMPAWFERVYAPRRCPERLMLAVQAIESETVEEIPKAPDSLPPVFVPPSISDSEKGLLAMLDRLRDAEATLHAQYLAAVAAGDEKKANFVFKAWSDITERLRAQEKSAPAALEALKIYVRRDEVARELAPLHATILQSLKQAMKQARTRLRQAVNAVEWNAAVEELVDEACRGLCDTSFAEPLELQVEAAAS
jgi:hypothetical protein